MSGNVKILPHYTYDDYKHWDGRWELIEGMPHAMSPLPIPKYQRIAARLTTEFSVQFRDCQACTVYQPLDYRVAEDTIVQPDMLIMRNEITKNYLDFSPELVAEILSPATALKDRYTKYFIYESQAIRYYLIISPDTEEVEIYELENNNYVQRQKGRDFSYYFSFGTCKATVDFKRIW